MIDKIRKVIGYRLDKNFWFKENFKEGFEKFNETNKTPKDSYESFIKLYCITNGVYLEKFNDKLKLTNPPVKVDEALIGVAGTFSKADFEKVNTEMNEKGYVHFEKKLSKELCDSITKFALATTSTTPPKYDKPVIYNQEQPSAEIYRFSIQDLVNNVDIQKLMMDPVLLNFARNYLGCEPIFDFPAMWWSTSFQKEASSEAAQLFHFDLDRIKWLKVFFYINDVTPDNGPHCYIEGSHKPNAKPADILNRGYVRVPDADLAPHYRPEAFKTVYGEAGSMFIGDTKCWHKGTPLKSGHRLVLELEYTSSLFGANYPVMEISNADKTFKDFCAKNKTFASNIRFKN